MYIVNVLRITAYAIRIKITPMRDYKKLDIYSKSRSLVAKVYEVTNSLPKEEMYSLTSQIRRAAISITANIAEGSSRGTEKEFARFLNISMASLCETESLLILAVDLKYVKAQETLLDELDHLRRMIINLQKKLVYKRSA